MRKKNNKINKRQAKENWECSFGLEHMPFMFEALSFIHGNAPTPTLQKRPVQKVKVQKKNR